MVGIVLYSFTYNKAVEYAYMDRPILIMPSYSCHIVEKHFCFVYDK